MKVNCLLLKTPDERHFFTHENNFPLLIEFGKNFGTEISLVTAEDVKILELEELAKSICSTTKNAEVPKYEILEIKLSKKEPIKSIKKTVDGNVVDQIINEMTFNLLGGKIVDFEVLASKFKVSKYQLAACIRKLRKKYSNIERVSIGKYIIHKKDYDYTPKYEPWAVSHFDPYDNHYYD